MTMNSKMLRVFVASVAGLAAAVAAMGIGGLPGAAASCQRSVAIDPQVTVSEAAGTLTFVVHTGSCAAAGSVSYVVADGAARRPGDFLLANGQLLWATGDTSSRRITATIARGQVHSKLRSKTSGSPSSSRAAGSASPPPSARAGSSTTTAGGTWPPSTAGSA